MAPPTAEPAGRGDPGPMQAKNQEGNSIDVPDNPASINGSRMQRKILPPLTVVENFVAVLTLLLIVGR